MVKGLRFRFSGLGFRASAGRSTCSGTSSGACPGELVDECLLLLVLDRVLPWVAFSIITCSICVALWKSGRAGPRGSG